MSEIKCLMCNGQYFRRAWYEVDVDVDIYSNAYNDVKVSYDSDVSVDVDTNIHNEIDSNGEINFKIESEERNRHYFLHETGKEYKYVCEDCSFIMSFAEEKDVESKKEERTRKEEENQYDWSNFGK
jgi:hypothetical protein